MSKVSENFLGFVSWCSMFRDENKIYIKNKILRSLTIIYGQVNASAAQRKCFLFLLGPQIDPRIVKILTEFSHCFAVSLRRREKKIQKGKQHGSNAAKELVIFWLFCCRMQCKEVNNTLNQNKFFDQCSILLFKSPFLKVCRSRYGSRNGGRLSDILRVKKVFDLRKSWKPK